ncbi:hypothetical protein NPS70_09320 [Streptomyces sp. C10-9-1]|uniref:hypothetical protein n=1 Tax=unclassified Streptomyces TaxID=2593676 RepID=UPI002111CB4A|nr:hypothetical protein [Streptomyces sp. C10-9-1]MCQ6553392.1 hypothetical protein [Streptomyces sp. C10-9-1]
MSWASWTTPGVYSGHGGVLTHEAGVVAGDLTLHTTWVDGEASVTVQYTGAADWFTVAGSPTPCPSEQASRDLHDAVLAAVRGPTTATVPPLPQASAEAGDRP